MNDTQLWSPTFLNRYGCFAITKENISPKLPKHHSIDNFSNQHLVTMNQTHSNQVILIDDFDNAPVVSIFYIDNDDVLTSPAKYSLIPDIPDITKHYHFSSIISVNSDAVITNSNNITLSVKTADCLPILIGGGQYISVIHAGRVGSLSDITKNTCIALKSLGVDYIRAWFGPCSCVCCYEIDRETHTHFDLIEENKQQIESIFELSHITYDCSRHYCTQCDKHLFYSYRCGDKSKRNMFFMMSNFS